MFLNLKSFLAANPGVGFTTSIGTSVASFFIAINPFLQFMGLCLGLYIAWLTIQAKHAERRERKERRAQ